MWDHIINIYSSELLRTKTKESRIIEHKKIDNLYFLPNNVFTRIFKELKKYIKMTINNIYIIYKNYTIHFNVYLLSIFM